MYKFEFGQTVFYIKYGDVIKGLFCGLDQYESEASIRLDDKTVTTIDLTYGDKLYSSAEEALEALRQFRISGLESEVKTLESRLVKTQNQLTDSLKQLEALRNVSTKNVDASQLGNVLGFGCED